MKSQKILDLEFWGIWATRAQKTYQALNPEPYLLFSQSGSYFLQNSKINPVKLWYLKKILDFWLQNMYQTVRPDQLNFSFCGQNTEKSRVGRAQWK